MKSPQSFVALPILIALITGLVILLVSWIKDDTFSAIGASITYKWLLTTMLILVLALIATIIYYQIKISQISPKDNKKDSEEVRQKTIMKNLSYNERETLTKFLKQKTKFLELQISSTLSNMERNGILFTQFHSIRDKQIGDDCIYHLSEWAWEYINKYKKDFSL